MHGEQDLGPLAAALTSSGPHWSVATESMLFGQFIGSWHLSWERTGPGGKRRCAEGELHFGWVLGGRAVQDVWIVPGPGEAGAGEPPDAFHGSTLRFYDHRIAGWRSTWVEPLNGRVRKFLGRPTESGIQLVSGDESPTLRWSFLDIRPDSFTWTGEVLDPDRGWLLEERMHATRREQR